MRWKYYFENNTDDYIFMALLDTVSYYIFGIFYLLINKSTNYMMIN